MSVADIVSCVVRGKRRHGGPGRSDVSGRKWHNKICGKCLDILGDRGSPGEGILLKPSRGWYMEDMSEWDRNCRFGDLVLVRGCGESKCRPGNAPRRFRDYPVTLFDHQRLHQNGALGVNLLCSQSTEERRPITCNVHSSSLFIPLLCLPVSSYMTVQSETFPLREFCHAPVAL